MPFRAFVGEVVFWMNIIFDVKNKTVFENSLVLLYFMFYFYAKSAFYWYISCSACSSK